VEIDEVDVGRQPTEREGVDGPLARDYHKTHHNQNCRQVEDDRLAIGVEGANVGLDKVGRRE
jgi:hypothetical protein